MEDFNLVTAQVVCKELGCGSALGIYNISNSANETKRITCQDGETPIDKCVQKDWCSRYSEVAAVECSGKMLFIIVHHGIWILLCVPVCVCV